MRPELRRRKRRGHTREPLANCRGFTTATIALELICQKARVIGRHALVGFKSAVEDLEDFGKVFHRLYR